jgi:predicted acylesterase/phospholipase RssA
MLFKHFTSLVIAGGATKVLAAIGIYKFLEEHKMMDQIKNFVGTSAGAVLSTFICLGYTHQEIVDFFDANLCNDQCVNSMNFDDMFNILNTYGLSSGDNMIVFFKRMIANKLGEDNVDISFIEFAKHTGKNLVICVANLTEEKREFWSVDTQPNMSIVTALRASCAIPLMFTPVVINDTYYLDGGLYDNFPIDYFQGNKLRDILGVNIKATGYQKTGNMLEYIKFILLSVMDKLSSQMLDDCKDNNMICLEFEDDNWFSLMDMRIILPKEKILQYMDIGYKSISDKLKSIYITTIF